jgi:GNAT superfamily N-acetyltransferase
VTADIEVRAATPDDAAVAADLRSRAIPHVIQSAAAMRARLSEHVYGAWVASLDGEPAGFARAREPVGRRILVTIAVPPEHRRRGLGSALLDHLWSHSAGDIDTIRAIADDPHGVAFARAHGFEVGRRHQVSAVDLTTMSQSDAAPLPAGITLRPLAEVDPHAVWRVTQDAAGDDPSGLFVEQPFAEWHSEDWAFPDHAPDLGVGAFDGADLVAYTQVFADHAQAAMWSAMTAVLPAHRGRGLGRLVKAAALDAARRAGLTRAFTGNDADNAPMLAINNALGYRPFATTHSVSRRR